MNIGAIDNSANGDFRRVITWQYDKAPRLIGLVLLVQAIYKATVEDPWNNFLSSTMDMDNLSAFGASLWGVNLGIVHPEYNDGTSMVKISDDYFGRILSGRMVLLPSSYSMYDITKFLKKVYGERVKVRDWNDDQSISTMTLHFSATESDLSAEELYLLQNNPDVALCHPAGIDVTFTLEG